MDKKIVCSGALFFTIKTNRFLFLHRANTKRENVWGLVGGTNESSETPFQGLTREITEEIGFLPKILKTIPLETFVSNDAHFVYHTYICVIEDEFIPQLNYEHNGYAWVSYKKWPVPLHGGLRKTLGNKINNIKIDTMINFCDLLQDFK